MDDYAKCEIAQSRGPRLKFEGKLIASDSFETHGQDVREMRMEVYETRGGALIAVTRSDWLDGGKREVVLATVVEPIAAHLPFNPDGPLRDDLQLAKAKAMDVERMRFAVMDAFDWHDRARSMVRNQLRWKLTMRVE